MGTRSPLTLGIKEANGGGTFGYALGQLKLAHLVLEGESPEWVVLRLTRSGEVFFDPPRTSSAWETLRRPGGFSPPTGGASPSPFWALWGSTWASFPASPSPT